MNEAGIQALEAAFARDIAEVGRRQVAHDEAVAALSKAKAALNEAGERRFAMGHALASARQTMRAEGLLAEAHKRAQADRQEREADAAAEFVMSGGEKRAADTDGTAACASNGPQQRAFMRDCDPGDETGEVTPRF